jgi:hypothetical protein
MLDKYFNPYQGDPKLSLGPDGSRLTFIAGQPVMDRGLENMVLISLFTKRGWCGNSLFDDPLNHVGSDFESAFGAPITVQALNDIRDAAEKALTNPIFGRVTVTVINSNGYIIQVFIRLEPPGQDIQTLLVERNGQNWIAQAVDPAYKRIEGY